MVRMVSLLVTVEDISCWAMQLLLMWLSISSIIGSWSMMVNVKLWGGFGEKKGNNGRQWYLQDRIFDSDGLCPSLTVFKSDYWIMIREK